jgi:hypothetical protein
MNETKCNTLAFVENITAESKYVQNPTEEHCDPIPGMLMCAWLLGYLSTFRNSSTMDANFVSGLCFAIFIL